MKTRPPDHPRTRAFDSWWLRERELRAFLRFGLQFGEEGLQRQWDEISARPWDGSSDTIDVFDRELDDLGPFEFEWLLRAAVVKDAVTLYEVYLEQAMDEVLQWHGLERRKRDESSPNWREFRDFYKLLDIDLRDPRVKKARRLRHLLTHRRGAISTNADRQRFGSTYPFPVESVDLTDARVAEALDALSASVLAVEALVQRYTWGGERSSAVSQLGAQQPATPSST